ncbi:hypothetical protein, partial [Sedimentibacter sp.]
MEITRFISENEIIDIVTRLVSIESHKNSEQKESEATACISNIFKNNDIYVECAEIEKNRPN